MSASWKWSIASKRESFAWTLAAAAIPSAASPEAPAVSVGKATTTQSVVPGADRGQGSHRGFRRFPRESRLFK